MNESPFEYCKCYKYNLRMCHYCWHAQFKTFCGNLTSCDWKRAGEKHLMKEKYKSGCEPFPCTKEVVCRAHSALSNAAQNESSKYERVAQEIGALVTAKQDAYGDSFGRCGEVMRILYPDGVPPSKLDDSLTVVRVLDKLFRIATDKDALGESPWRDIAGYAILAVERKS